MFARSNSKAISKTLKVCRAVSEGDFEARIIGIEQKGELGELMHAINLLIDRTDAYVRESMACLEYVSDGKYFRRIHPKGMLGAFANATQVINDATATMESRVSDFTGVVGRFETSMRGVVQTVSSAGTELQASAQTMDLTATSTTEQATAVAAAAEQASANVQTVASAAEELSSSVKEIGRQVVQSNEITNDAVKQAERTNVTIQGLNQAVQKIDEVVGLITDIADQTNLLALNATIEAARAGDAGKGFAVVASEVKNLADQTAKATEEISGQIGGIQIATKEAVDAIDTIGGTIGEVNEIATSIAAAIEEQGTATLEVTRNVEQAAQGTQEVTTNITNVSQAATETGAAAGQVLGASGELSQQAELLNSEVHNFLEEVRKVV